MEWTKMFFDIHKLPFKINLLFVVVSGIIVFNPHGISAYLKLDTINNEWGRIIGICFLVFSGLAVVNIVIEIYRKIELLFLERRFKEKKINYINQLDYAEQAVLREFFIQGLHNIKLPIDNPTVVGLINNRIIILAGKYGQMQLSGQIFPVCLNDDVREYIENNPATIKISQNESKDWLLQNRPPFMYDIERYNGRYY